MTEPTSGLSRLGFDRLISRALELEEEGNEQIDLERARAIASELGISAAAWEAAVREREAAAARSARLRLRGRAALVALVGLVTGGLGGAMASRLADGVPVLGGVAVAVGVALAVSGIRRRSMRGTQTELAAWWLSVPAGIMLGLGELHGDPMVFASTAWVGCASLSVILDRLRRRAPSPGSLTEAPTA